MNLAQGTVTAHSRRRIFLSYKRHAEPDESVARVIFDTLARAEHSVFIDQMISPSEKWAQRIEREIRDADWLIVLLTEPSSRSEMVKGEIEIARDQASRFGGAPRILPVRVSFDGRLPYPLNAYLDEIQYASWKENADTPHLLEQIVALVREGQETCGGAAGSTGEAGSRCPPPPAYAAPLAPTGGALDVEDPIYIVRRSEQKAVSLLSGRGTTLVIKGPRQIGKSSLLNRLALAAMERGKKVALLDLQLFDEGTREKPDTFCHHFLRTICEALGLPQPPSGLPNVAYTYNCTLQMEEFVLGSLQQPVLLAIDEADRLFHTPFRLDFFSMLRAWHDRRSNPTKRIWKNLDLALVTATEPYMFIDVPTQSPFNVGEVMRLEDFTRDELADLNLKHARFLDRESVDRLFEFFSGHPYLTRRAFYELIHVGTRTTPEMLFDQGLNDDGPFRDHLRYYCFRLLGQPALAAAFLRLLNGGVTDEVTYYRLEAAGLVKREGGRVVARCKLYAEYFRRHMRLP